MANTTIRGLFKIPTTSPDYNSAGWSKNFNDNFDKLDATLAVEVESADGAIGIKEGIAIITKSTAAALTLAAPTAGLPSAGGDDGKMLTILSTTAAAHTVTNTTPGFNGGGTGSDVATFGAAIGNNLNLIAYGGKWYIQSALNVTAA